MNTNFANNVNLNNSKIFSHPVDSYKVTLKAFNAMINGKKNNIIFGLCIVQKNIYKINKINADKNCIKTNI